MRIIWQIPTVCRLQRTLPPITAKSVKKAKNPADPETEMKMEEALSYPDSWPVSLT